MSMSSVSSREQQLESHLKDILQQILIYFENFIETSEDLIHVEQDLKDYDDLPELCLIIKEIFKKLTLKIDSKIKNQRHINIPQKKSNEYEKLESIIQKHEAEIRQHISNEHQMRLYAESLQQQLEESEQTRLDFIKQTTKLINNIKRENLVLTQKLKQQQQESEKLQSRLNSITVNDREYEAPDLKEQQKLKKEPVQKNNSQRMKETKEHQLLMNLVKEQSDLNQSTEYAGTSQQSTKLGQLTNSGGTAYKLGRRQGTERQTIPSNRNTTEDHSILKRKKGTSMHFKRDYSSYHDTLQTDPLVAINKHKSHSVAISKHTSQENSISIEQQRPPQQNSKRRSSTSDSQRKYKEWQATLLKNHHK